MRVVLQTFIATILVVIKTTVQKDIDIGVILSRDIVSVKLTDMFSQVQKLDKFEISAEFPGAGQLGYSGGNGGVVDTTNLGLKDSTCLDTIISPDQKLIALLCDKKNLILIDSVSGKKLYSYKPERFGTCHKPQIHNGYLYLFCTTSESKGRYVQFHEVYAFNLRDFTMTHTDMNLGDDQFMGWFQFDVQTTIIETSMLNTVNDTNPDQKFAYLTVWDGYNNVAASTWITSYNKNVRFIRIEGGKISNQSILLKVDDSDQHGLVYDVAMVDRWLNVVIHANSSRWTPPKGYSFDLEVNDSFVAVASTNRSYPESLFNITDGFFRYVPSINRYIAWDLKRNELFSCQTDEFFFVKECTIGAKALQDSNNMIPRVKNCVKDPSADGEDKENTFLCSYDEKKTENNFATSSGVIRITPDKVELLSKISNPNALGYYYSPDYDKVITVSLTQIETGGLTPSTFTVDASKLPVGRPFEFAVRNSQKSISKVVGQIVDSDSNKVEVQVPARKVLNTGWKKLSLSGVQGTNLKVSASAAQLLTEPWTSTYVYEGSQNNFTKIHRAGSFLIGEFNNQGRANVFKCAAESFPNNQSRSLETYCEYLTQVTFDSSRWLVEVFHNEGYGLLLRIRGFNSEQYLRLDTQSLQMCNETIKASSPEQVFVNNLGSQYQIIHTSYDSSEQIKIYTLDSDCKLALAGQLNLQSTGYLTKFTAGLSNLQLPGQLLIYQQDLTTPSTIITDLGNLKLINDSSQIAGPYDKSIFDPQYSKYCFLGKTIIVSYTLNGFANVFQYKLESGSKERKTFPLKQFNLTDVTEIHCSESHRRIVLVAKLLQAKEYVSKIIILTPDAPRVLQILDYPSNMTNCTRGFFSSSAHFTYSCMRSTWTNTTDAPALNELKSVSYPLSLSPSVILDPSSPNPPTKLTITGGTDSQTDTVSLTLTDFKPQMLTKVKHLDTPIKWNKQGELSCFELESVLQFSGHVFGVRSNASLDSKDTPVIQGRIRAASKLPTGFRDLASTSRPDLYLGLSEQGATILAFDESSKQLRVVQGTEMLSNGNSPAKVTSMIEENEGFVMILDVKNTFYVWSLNQASKGAWQVSLKSKQQLELDSQILRIQVIRTLQGSLQVRLYLASNQIKFFSLTEAGIILDQTTSISSQISNTAVSMLEGEEIIFGCEPITGKVGWNKVSASGSLDSQNLITGDPTLTIGGCGLASQKLAKDSKILLAVNFEHDSQITVYSVSKEGKSETVAILELPESASISSIQITNSMVGVNLVSAFLRTPLWCLYKLPSSSSSTPPVVPIYQCTSSSSPSPTLLELSPSLIYLSSPSSPPTLWELTPSTTLCYQTQPASSPLPSLTLNWNTSLDPKSSPDDPNNRPNPSPPSPSSPAKLSLIFVLAGLTISFVLAGIVTYLYCRSRTNTLSSEPNNTNKESLVEHSFKDNEL